MSRHNRGGLDGRAADTTWHGKAQRDRNTHDPAPVARLGTAPRCPGKRSLDRRCGLDRRAADTAWHNRAKHDQDTPGPDPVLWLGTAPCCPGR